MDREKTTKAGKNFTIIIMLLVFFNSHNNKMPDNQSLLYRLL